MTKQHLLILGLLLSGAGALSSGCSDTKAVTIGDDAGAAGEAGSDGKAGSENNAGSANAGSGNAGSGNSSGDAGAAGEGGIGGAGGEGGEGGEPPFVFPPSLNPQGVVVVGATPASSAHLLVAGVDYTAKKDQGEVVSITLASGAVGDSAIYQDSDLVATSSAGIGFAIERSNDKVHQLDGGKISKTFDLKAEGTNDTAIAQKAYVPVLNQSLIVVLDLGEGKVSHRIDLSDYNTSGDSDHSADIAAGVYDPSHHIAYFVLQRIDRLSINAASNYQLRCTADRGLIVGIDTETDEVVDLNGNAKGKAIELQHVNPTSLSINADGSALYLLANGCFEGDTKIHQGVEVVDLTDGTSTIAYVATGNDYLASLIRTVGADALIESFDDAGAKHWHKIDLSQGTLGAEIANVPSAPSFDGADLIGVEVTGKVGKVVRYKIATETSTEISATSWGGQYSYATATALVE
ncbi:MAG TPA: hypothetical protein VER11_03810 [Polyangiaceae bacterium]|nr:hypothetical protein [Polyangiaceae bacterium]